ncbi:MAG TPA: serine/threonine-protein kinase [Burkholderiales bacterium]|nr:serine/threonine-protein kinase [Burkholderiales bacterium]
MTPEPGIERQRSDADARRARPRRSLAWIFFGTTEQRVEAVAIAILILAGVGWWTWTGVKHSVEDARRGYVRALLDAKVAALDVWVSAKLAEANRWATVPEVVDAVRTLEGAARAGASREALRSAPAQAQFAHLLVPAIASDPERVAANAVDSRGRIVAARAAAQVGLTVGRSMQADLARVFAGESRFLPPRPESERVPGAHEAAFVRPVAWFAAPVKGPDGKVVASLEIGSYADTRFARILAPPAELADPASSSDVYAFDESALLLTTSRYRETLRAAGLIPVNARTAAFNVHLHDPGVDLRDDAAGSPDYADRPFTRLIAAAITSRKTADETQRRGELLVPYRNYVGREVIGAWEWLPDYDIGVAIELAASEAYAPLRYLRIALLTIFGLLVVAVGAALGSSFSLARLDREVRHLGQYRIERKIDEGGMATVHRGVHALLKRPTAIKILKPALATDEVIARFEREVRLASRLEHPATVEIFDYGRTRDGTFYYAMEYIDGITLATLVEKDGAQPVARVAHILKQVCESLREAHGKGLIHRDVKPQNVMLCERGGESDVVKVLDFGLIKDVRATDTRDITQYARLLGTPAYMAPERIRNPAEANPTVDIYALGALAFLLLTGRRLFEAPNELELEHMVLEVDAPRASAVAEQPIPPELDALLARCVAKDPAARPQRVDELIDALAAVLAAHPWSQHEAAHWWQDYNAAREMAAV